MKKTVTRALVLAVALLAPTYAHAQIVDQSNYCVLSSVVSASNCVDGTQARYGWGQEFTPDQNNTIGASVFVHNTSDQSVTTFFTFQMCSDQIPASGCTNVQTSANFTVSAGAYLQLVALLPTWVAVTPNLPDNPSDDFFYFETHDNGSLVSVLDHSAYTKNGDAAFNYLPDGNVNHSSSYYGGGQDIWFEEYADHISATPEPASMVLLGTGLLGVIGVARRRRNK